MKGLQISYHLFLPIFLLLFVVFVVQVRGEKEKEKNVYVVYMGATTSTGPSLRDDHVQLLASVLEREVGHAEKSILHSYKHGFSGFTARLSVEEARAMAKKPAVVSVFVDPILQLHTTRSWDFLQYQTDLETDSNNGSDADSASGGTDTIIGLLDTGVWPESESFSDGGMGEIPARWKGVCKGGYDFNASSCNRKLIGARYYNDPDSASRAKTHDETARDSQGHGTHTASTAAGGSVPEASYYGLAVGTAKGGSPTSRIAVYKVCGLGGCLGSAILAAFDDAIADGVDVLSLSLGASVYLMPDFDSDPIAIGAFHAVEKGIIVVCSAGNNGPIAKSVVNAAPWILTVGATTIDRDMESDVILGGNSTLVKGEAINFSNLGKSPVYPLIYGGSAKTNSSSEDDARNCNLNALDRNKINGTIVLCEHSDTIYSKRQKRDMVKKLGGVGLVLVDDTEKLVAFTYGVYPMTVISSDAAAEIHSYINSTRNPVATILPTVSVTEYKPAPAVAYFSSRGPSIQTGNILKPDVAAPGVNILAAWIPTNDSSEVPPGQKPSQFNLLSGTSMACPHVSGIAATIKSKNPTWSPAAIRSAIMTTATQTNNDRAPLTQDSGSIATPYDYGAGEVSPSGALQPGLVYEIETNDYLLFLCNYGYQASMIKKIASIPDGFSCPNDSSKDLISNLNYPSIAISKFDGKGSKKVNRTVTNVGADESVYVASVKSPSGLVVKVVPDTLEFTKTSKKMSYQVIFSSSASSSPATGDVFGSITWTDGKHKVRSPFVVTNA
ncbi:CO(2)-response secreted protease [Magnolia sinica]|uniref:CO(2)-response secreted protease n=1 Tax=Magnolia sinica TaxID=86752 RepID=UPI002659F73F|nr:CO(2)-response secreted protease [Magnolia sinica]